jgi:ATP-binding cassette subfamily B protein
MVAAFYGKYYSLEKLREMCYLSHEGVSLLGISEAAEKIGLHSIGVQMSIERMINEVPLPCIVHWNQNHFVVLYRIYKKGNKHKFCVADPAGSKITYTKEEFCRSWLTGKAKDEETGIALCIETTPFFYEMDEDEREKKNKRNLTFLFSYLRPYKKLIFQLFAGLATGSVLQLILPFLMQSIVDFGITNQNLGYIYLVLLAQLVLVVSSTSVEFIRGWILLHLGTRVNISLISDYLAKLMRLPIAYFDTKMTGDILQRISDHSRIQEFLTNSSLTTLFSLVNILIFGTVIFIYDWRIFFIFVVGSVLYVAWVWLFMNKRAVLDHKMFAQHSVNQSNIIQLVTGMQEIKLNACEQQKRWDWERIQARIFKLTTKGLALSQYQQSGGVLINQVKNVIITALVAAFVVKGEITLGMMLAIQYIIGQLNSPIDQLITFFRQYQDAKLSLERLQEIYSKENEESDNKVLIRNIKNSNIQINNLTFRYDKLSETPTLNHINLTIQKGKTTAIVGLSGSGKTTLLKMILGFYLPDKGEVVVGSSNLENYNKREWRKCCGTVMQDGFIFSDTIARNIAPGVENIDEEILWDAAEIANIRDFVEDLPLRYNTKIGAEGHGLSQGQKQRILIARAVYKNPQFIFLDEATNSLDANNERSIMNKLHKFLTGRTAVIIAHRLSTVRNADQIVVLEQGDIKEQGTHEDLIRMQGIYYSLVKNQLDV